MSTAPNPGISPQLDALFKEAAGRGLDIMESLLQQTRERLKRQAEQSRDFSERDACTRGLAGLTQVAPDLRSRFPQTLRAAFERELGDDPATTTLDAGPNSIHFDQLELMDEEEVQARISAVRGLQQAMVDCEAELAELNTLVGALLGFEQVRPERNPLRPEVFLYALQDLIKEAASDQTGPANWAPLMVPMLGKTLRPVYQALLALLRQQQIQPVGYAIHRPAQIGGVASTGIAPKSSGQDALRGSAQAASAAGTQGSGLTMQQLHSLVVGLGSGAVAGSAEEVDRLVHEVVQLIIATIVGDERLLPPVRELIQDLSPALITLARKDLHFFSDKAHPARLLMEEIAQNSFAFDNEESPGFAPFLFTLKQALAGLGQAQTGKSQVYAEVLADLRRHWAEESTEHQARQHAAVKTLKQAERRNELASEVAKHIRTQPGTALVPDVVVEFACGPWAQVMAQAQLEGKVSAPKSGQLDHVALLEDLFWSVRPDLTRQQPGQLVRMIPELLRGLRQGLNQIQYPQTQVQQFFDQLLVLHQGVMEEASGTGGRGDKLPAQPWLAPAEARESGFMDDLVPDVEARPAADFPTTEPMVLPDPQAAPAATSGPGPSASWQPGTWVELEVQGQWSRLQLIWVNEHGTLCLFAGPGGSNHSMTRRMLDRLLAEGRLKRLAQGTVVQRAFDAVAEMALRNSVYMDIKADPPG